ncbi:MAG: universal stress protein [Euryarchaeota archaeon]|nr:universal stress protein [Euryarchaeota archaeon]
MTLYDRILVPTDGSPEGEQAIAHAVDLAEAHGATVSGLYVINTASYNGLPMEASWEGVTTLLNTDAQEAVETVEELGDERDVPVETEITEGSPSTEIVRAAESQGCDLIVMGTHGRGGIDRLLLGSVAEKVVRAAHVPVLTVRVGAEPAAVSDRTAAEGETDSETAIQADQTG